ncbi:response regulator of the LytR/AlgR family [Cryptobacterium curtum DSM 15641]|uniref:Response regulator of the LytR/AlgR family n=1 Tax=Cryptobacterium curtum (strain ATCC 700683 / DSM 15641 / CCUG 43107 / 12-3) TaxID=469378 RepID=C7MLF3_CRYCD|nr:LytTR family DNA-binding domain-containing protein [Cryptobacterium curtum]ACU93759.1 response regulator of the LytR/AlgR family [Cryptobacterium curtum DSM 15641]
MKITIEEQPSAQDIEVTIVCKKTDGCVLDMLARLRMLDRKVTGSVDGRTHVVSAEDVLYVESVDKRTFIYTTTEVLETTLRLYEMEERLTDCDFLRVAKGCVVNFRKITALEPEINGRIIATMENSERVVISRQYAPDVKRKLGLLQ